MEKILEYTLSSHISRFLGKNFLKLFLSNSLNYYILSVNLISCMGVLSNIARQRSQYILNVLKVFEKLKSKFSINSASQIQMFYLK